MLKRLLLQELSRLAGHKVDEVKLLFPEHHLSHAASAFYPSPFEEAAILTIDGVGEWATASICHGKGDGIEILRELRFPHSVGLLYSAFTYYLGFRVNSGEYKLMGLAPYGDPDSERTRRFEELIATKMVDIAAGRVALARPGVLRLRHRAAHGQRAGVGAALRVPPARGRERDGRRSTATWRSPSSG